MIKRISFSYKCRCMPAEAEATVHERGQTETIEDFMERVKDVLRHEHRKRAPLCMLTTMQYVKIPVGTKGVGDDD